MEKTQRRLEREIQRVKEERKIAFRRYNRERTINVNLRTEKKEVEDKLKKTKEELERRQCTLEIQID